MISDRAPTTSEARQSRGALQSYARRPTLASPGVPDEASGAPYRRPHPDQLEAVLYVSTATRWLTAAELERLLKEARQRNLECGVTGVLLYSYGNFMQYFEGPAEGVTEVYEVIRRSALHQGLIELLHEPIDAREFDDWTMAFRDISAFGVSDPPAIDRTFAGGPSETPMHASAARRLLTRFWNKGGVRSGC